MVYRARWSTSESCDFTLQTDSLSHIHIGSDGSSFKLSVSPGLTRSLFVKSFVHFLLFVSHSYILIWQCDYMEKIKASMWSEFFDILSNTIKLLLSWRLNLSFEHLNYRIRFEWLLCRAALIYVATGNPLVRNSSARILTKQKIFLQQQSSPPVNGSHSCDFRVPLLTPVTKTKSPFTVFDLQNAHCQPKWAVGSRVFSTLCHCCE